MGRRGSKHNFVPEGFDYSGFRPVKDFPGYIINRDGVIISLKTKKAKFIKHFFNHDFYICVSLMKAPYKTVQQTVAYLLLRTFGPPRPSRNHKALYLDGNKENFKLENLKWTTRKEIMKNTMKRIHSTTNNKKKKVFYLVYPDKIERVEGRAKITHTLRINPKLIDSYNIRKKDNLMVFSEEGYERFKKIMN